ncbi:TauD/TfdA dioxygenase family protein [Aspergillus ibericus CBS 121593]|uniref:Putative alpha-ketoglutarate-dependent sulfonate dioxygenase n=1 Tax=Aspergillus ibericus CBS 121593 TaxID=1448316 RepID=A0A395GJK7_9EURO|nr:putative alpha-ketoglutarate-dependent sulfonate dioxygenase [Aspergillus ibericus CBS 121593]RAK95671.1 putative alpha-ketoglutarate-dependent sulfonate dioxygenase [Aspergillus ibericus CBS 121593]
MAPSITHTQVVVPPSKPTPREPLKPTGALSSYPSFDVTPVIGREFTNANLKEWLEAPNSDDLLRDLAITISQRGVVFFRQQNDLTNDLQKQLINRLGQLTGKPSTSGLHIHPVINSGREHGNADDEISVISSREREKLYKGYDKKQSQRREWHSDITFEPVPSDYTVLRLTELPVTGGDTLWASGYELYDRISEPYQKFLEGLTATYAQPGFNEIAKNNGFEVFTGPRGAPENVGEKLEAIHPVIRTNPVTGWKSVFAVGHHVQKINGLAEEESRHLLDWFVKLIVENHDLQVRFRWQNPNDLAIWDNRSVYHAATVDYAGLGSRTGQRAVGLGERPYLDPNSTGRREALARE